MKDLNHPLLYGAFVNNLGYAPVAAAL